MLVTACALALAPAAHAKRKRKGPMQVVPPKKKPKRADEDLSDAGRRKGTTEFVLGSVTAAGAVAMIGRGIWELVVRKQIQRSCARDTVSVECDPSNPFDPVRGGAVAAGLSFALVVPFGIATGLLFHRGVKTNRHYKRWHDQHDAKLSLTGVGRNTGVSLSVRF